MSIVINKSLLSSDQIKSISEALYVVPKVDKYLQKKFYSHGKSPKGVKVYLDGDDHVRLPFSYACNLFKKSNDTVNHAKVSMKFTGQIWDKQKEFLHGTIDMLNRKRTSVLNLPPGYGKTTMSSAISCAIGLLTVILIYDSTLYTQWANTYKQRSTAIVWMVGEEAPPSTVDVIICLWTRVTSISKQLRDSVGVLIIDEAHEFPNQTGINSILGFTPKYIIAATATFEKRNDMHMAIEAIVGNEKVATDYKKPFMLFKWETGIEGTIEKSNGVTSWHILNKSLLYNEKRNLIVVNIVVWLLQNNRKIMVFTTEVDHAVLLYNLLTSVGVECDYFTGEKPKFRNTRVLISNTQKSAVGFDEEMFCDDFDGIRIDAIVYTGPFRDLALRYQANGRARADNPWIIHMLDKDKTTNNQYRDAEWFYRNNGGTILNWRNTITGSGWFVN